MSSRAALRQPLPYFVLAGAIVFLVDTWLRQRDTVIQITGGVRREVAAEFEAQLGRPPSDEEQQKALQNWVTTELLFREAERLGLENNDAVIRAHLANKLRQLIRERTITAPPTEAELRAELDAHPERYAKSDTFNVSHAFVNRKLAPDTFEARAAVAWKELNEGNALGTVGDHFPRGPSFEGMSQPQLEAILHVELGRVLKRDQVGKWHRLSSPRGAHFVRLDAVISGKPTLESARAALVEDREASKRDAAVRQYVEELEKEYRVVADAVE